MSEECFDCGKNLSDCPCSEEPIITEAMREDIEVETANLEYGEKNNPQKPNYWAPCTVCGSTDICCGNREKGLCEKHCTYEGHPEDKPKEQEKKSIDQLTQDELKIRVAELLGENCALNQERNQLAARIWIIGDEKREVESKNFRLKEALRDYKRRLAKLVQEVEEDLEKFEK